MSPLALSQGFAQQHHHRTQHLVVEINSPIVVVLWIEGEENMHGNEFVSEDFQTGRGFEGYATYRDPMTIVTSCYKGQLYVR